MSRVRMILLTACALAFAGCLEERAPDEATRIDQPALDGSDCPGQGFMSSMLPGCRATTCYYAPLTAPRCPALTVPTPCQPIPGYCRVGEMFIGCTGQPTMRWGTTSNCDTEAWANCGNNGAFCGDDSHTLICGPH